MIYPGVVLPPFIQGVSDEGKYCLDHFRNCLAWVLTTQRTHEEKAEHLKKLKPAARSVLEPHLLKCEAWVLLCTKTTYQIRRILDYRPEAEAAVLRSFLNELKPTHKALITEVTADD